MEEKCWLKTYPPGIPAEIDPDRYTSLTDFLLQKCERFSDKPAFCQFNTYLSYAELEEQSHIFAAYLQQQLALKKGERIAIMLPNLLQYPIALFGILRAGLVAVNVNPLYTVDELTYQLNDADVSAIIVLESFAHTVAQALPRVSLKHIIITKLGDVLPLPRAWCMQILMKYVLRKIKPYSIPHAIYFKTVMKEGRKLSLTPVTINKIDAAFLQYTGGTTGVPKGAVLTHRNILANIEQMRAWVDGLLREKEEIFLTALPLYHIFALTANCFLAISFGGLSVLILNPRDISALIRVLKKIPCTIIMGVNTLFNALLHHKDFKSINFSTLKFTLAGGMALQEAVEVKWQSITGVPIIEGYGLTETSPAVTIDPLTLTHYNGSIGLPIPSTDIAICDDNEKALSIGQAGELYIKGPQVMREYWRNPEETKKVFSADGWFKTGDIARIDEDGFIYLIDRKKDMINVSGFNVYPNEVEAVIAAHPSVLEVGVVGVVDEHSGEAVKAFIVKKDPHLDEQTLRMYLHEHLTGYKLPKYIEFKTELPKSSVGKILRRNLDGNTHNRND